MKLFYSPGACSLSPHIALREAGLQFTLERVDLRSKKMASGGDFRDINAKGYVPALQLDDGSLLTEGPAIVQYIADKAPLAQLLPASGMARYKALEWLTYLNGELHKGFSPLFNPSTTDEKKQEQRAILGKKFDYVTQQLGQNPYLLGDVFSAADGYLLTIFRWCRLVGIDPNAWPVLVEHEKRTAARPMVHAALEAEGLLR